MATFTYDPVPEGNDDFLTNTTIASSEMNGNFEVLKDHLNSEFVDTANIVDGAVTTAKILDGTIVDADISGPLDDPPNSGIDGAKLKDNTVDTLQLAPNAVTTAEIEDLTILGADIADGTISAAKLNFTITPGILPPNSVGSVEIVDGSIAQVDMGNNSVGTAEIIDVNVTLAKLAPDSVDASKIVDNSVGTAELAPDSVTAAEIAPDAVGNSEIATDAVGSAEIALGAVGSSEIATGAVDADELVQQPFSRIFRTGTGTPLAAANVWQDIIFPSVDGGHRGISVRTSVGKNIGFTVTKAGIYAVHVSACMTDASVDANSADECGARIKSSIANFAAAETSAVNTGAGSGLEKRFSCSTALRMNVGDWVEGEFISDVTGVAPGADCEMTIAWVGKY